ncbi:AraC family transcriptional regulator [Rhizobacter sp. J219]|jgi:AraC-like DNA-binding protein|uniref:AraC family transcriptional regulator n=1 Tax=Rhizobacter sp. J219 TaxID=2898430 RepID=UPI002150BBB5|nr:AraC family transcriptional regulator [Rhizobacter sp. J219]MCR5883443.1 AraC family transcriptional regulator [Rhizobacter sp. J219]
MNTSVDRLSSLLERFRVRAHLFHHGPLCGVTHYAAEPGRGFLHVMRSGEMVLTHRARSGAPKKLRISEPTLLFYPRPLAHDFHNAPAEGCDFTCAAVEFEGGDEHPLARALPPVVVLPLAQLPTLQHTLTLLFAETEQVRCGHRLLANRLFEVLLLQLLRWLLDHPEESGVPTGLLNGLSHPQLAKALVALHEAPGDAWSLPRMAECAGMSRSAFAAAFKSHVGEGPAEYLAQWRLSIAQTRLRQGSPLKTIAEDLGYSSASALSRVFAQKVGRSPRDWLRHDTLLP